MKTSRQAEGPIEAEPIENGEYAPFGYLIGSASAEGSGRVDPNFDSASVSIWRHSFGVSEGGHPDLLWVHYRPRQAEITRMEMHLHCDQAIVPVGKQGRIIHVVAPNSSNGDGPDLNRLRAFVLPGDVGVCYRPLVWHTHFGLDDNAFYLMINRKETSDEIMSEVSLTETVVTEITPAITVIAPR